MMKGRRRRRHLKWRKKMLKRVLIKTHDKGRRKYRKGKKKIQKKKKQNAKSY
jgi:hypothetical protein